MPLNQILPKQDLKIFSFGGGIRIIRMNLNLYKKQNQITILAHSILLYNHFYKSLIKFYV